MFVVPIRRTQKECCEAFKQGVGARGTKKKEVTDAEQVKSRVRNRRLACPRGQPVPLPLGLVMEVLSRTRLQVEVGACKKAAVIPRL